MYSGRDQILELCVIVWPLLLKHNMCEHERARTRSQLRAEIGQILSLFLAAYVGFSVRQDVGFSQKPLVFEYTAPAARALSFLIVIKSHVICSKNVYSL